MTRLRRVSVVVFFLLASGSIARTQGFGLDFASQVTITYADHHERIPRPRFQPYPLYPVELLVAFISGTVKFTYTVLPAGNVGDIRFEQSSAKEFTRAVAAAVPNWRFDPFPKPRRFTCVIDFNCDLENQRHQWMYSTAPDGMPLQKSPDIPVGSRSAAVGVPDWRGFNAGSLHRSKVFLTVRVLGGVNVPGVYHLSESESVWDAIAAAGGPALGVGEFTVTRTQPNGSVKKYRMDLRQRSSAGPQPLLEEGDSIFGAYDSAGLP